MKKHHYVYHSYEEWGREYIGCRTCDCLPEEDTKYFGSFKDKTFSPTEKTILFVCKTRKEAMEIEIELHDFFNVAVNPQFANRSKQTSTKFDTTGVPRTKEDKKKISEANSGKTRTEETKKKISESKSNEKHPMFGVPHTEEWKQAMSERMSGENHPQFGVPNSEAQKKAHSERMSGENNPMYGMSGENSPNYGNTGALSPCSKAIIAIKPDGTELHFGGIREAARVLETHQSGLGKYSKTGQVLKWGKFKGWRFIYKNSTNF